MTYGSPRDGHLCIAEGFIDLAVEDIIPDAWLRHVVVAVLQCLRNVGISVETDDARNEREVKEKLARCSILLVTSFFAVWACCDFGIRTKKTTTRVDAAMIKNWLNSGEIFHSCSHPFDRRKIGERVEGSREHVILSSAEIGGNLIVVGLHDLQVVPGEMQSCNVRYVGLRIIDNDDDTYRFGPFLVQILQSMHQLQTSRAAKAQLLFHLHPRTACLHHHSFLPLR